jgi:hypothetical protein
MVVFLKINYYYFLVLENIIKIIIKLIITMNVKLL